MLKKCKVVMLPTNQKATEGTLYLQNNVLRKSQGAITNAINQNEGKGKINHQYLYILSDDKIVKDDWMVNYNVLPIHPIIAANSTLVNSGGCTKIIASTDSSLGYNDVLSIHQRKGLTNHYPTFKTLPSIPQSFIEYYVSEYNKGNKIEEVMVEYEGYDNGNSMNDSSIMNYRLKLNPDNTINIKPIKNNWSKEELNEEAMKFYKKYHGILNQSDMQSIAKLIEEL